MSVASTAGQVPVQPDESRAPRWRRNPALRGLVCQRCGSRHGWVELPTGCPRCRAEGHPASMQCEYAPPLRPARSASGYPWGTRLPYLHGITLGEGDTPQVELPQFDRLLRGARLAAKLESCNPTGSHKDRMSALGITRALELRAPLVALASSGNAAVSAAAYAAAADLPCEVAAYTELPPPFARALEAHGARVLRFASSAQRWAHVAQRVAQDGAYALTNFSTPAVGSAAAAVEGYKAVAYEIAESGPLPTRVLVPVARGDLLSGLQAGFAELVAAGITSGVPQLWAVEPFARLTRVLAGEPLQAEYAGRTAQFSVAGATVTDQQWRAVQTSGGGALVVDDTAAREAQQMLARAGIWAELCSAATLRGACDLAQRGLIGAGDRVLIIVTARGDREPVPV